MNLRESLSRDAIKTLRMFEPITVGVDRSVGDAIELMQKHRSGYIIIMDQDQPVGIFTERDILTKVLPESIDLKTLVSKIMTRSPKTIKEGSSVSDVIHTMYDGGFRHLPVVNNSGKLCGVISVKRIVEYLVEHFPEAVFNLPPEPVQQQLSREGA